MKFKFKRLIVTGVSIFLTSGYAYSETMQAAENSQSHQAKVIVADNVTGLNTLKGQPLRDFGPDLFGTFGFYNSMAYNPDSNLPSVFSPETPDDALMATGIDPVYAGLFGLTPADLDTSYFNIPLRDVGTIVSEDGNVRTAALANTLDVDVQEPSQSFPVDPITLGDWLKASGKAYVKCNNGQANITLNMKKLIPNRLYTVWALHATPSPRPFGGVPNAFITDEKGNAKWKRKIGYCPMEDNPNPLKQLSIVLHSDHLVYGDLPGIPFRRTDSGLFGLMTGAISHSQLEFAFRGTRVKN